MAAFWDREVELARIRRRLGAPGFGYVTGRRRVGKTALLREAVRRFGGFYHQAVEGTPRQQLLHFTEEAARPLAVFRDLAPRTWTEFFRLLSLAELPRLVVWDEFPYWSQGDASLASPAQKWVDHELPGRRTLLLISVSAQAMLHSQFLSRSSPLYGRATLRLHLEPLSYAWFCRALGYDPAQENSFVRFSLVGGVPHYRRLMPKAILDLVGRGVARPGELASRRGAGARGRVQVVPRLRRRGRGALGGPAGPLRPQRPVPPATGPGLPRAFGLFRVRLS